MALFRQIKISLVLLLGYFVCTPVFAGELPPSSEGKLIPYPANPLVLLISEAIESNPSVQSQLSMAQMARSGVDGARWQYFPTPIATFQQAHTAKNDPSYQGSNRVFLLGLQQPIWTGGKLTAGLNLAENQLLSALQDLELSKQEVAIRVSQAFSSWLGASQKIRAYEKSAQTHRKLLALIQRRIDQGISPKSDYIFAQGRLEQVLIELDAAQSQADVALMRLRQLVGMPLAEKDLIGGERALLSYSEDAEPLLKMALESNPRILKAKTMVAIQENQISAAKAAPMPVISAQLQRQNGDFSYTNYVSPVENRAFISVSTNFGAGLSNYSQISGAMAKKDSAVSDEELTRRNISEQVLSDAVLLKKERYRVKASHLAYQAALSTTESWGRQFLAGKKAWQDLLNSARELALSEANLADANAALMEVNWRLAIATYGLSAVLDAAFSGPFPSEKETKK